MKNDMVCSKEFNDLLLYPHQKEAIKKLKNGSILVGGVGTGKSRTALAYYAMKESNKPLYIITTARKRDTKDWEKESEPFSLSFIVDSWNNIAKYKDVEHAFFIFDEQRIVGYGVWVKVFLKIAKKNRWILLTATPGDTWIDYIPVFIANGFYRNKTDFVNQHVIYSRFSKYPKIDGYANTEKLVEHRKDIVVQMFYKKKTLKHDETIFVPHNRDLMKLAIMNRWNFYKDEPIKDAGGLCYVLRRIANEDERRIEAVEELLELHKSAIIFYNFNYELDLLRSMARRRLITCAEWNGQKHDPLPDDPAGWIYLVQYTAGAEGWNCTTTDTVIFYSQSYSYKSMEQAAGRIDRLNTPYQDLYYYHLVSRSGIDLAIRKAIKEKRIFNEKMFDVQKS